MIELIPTPTPTDTAADATTTPSMELCLIRHRRRFVPNRRRRHHRRWDGFVVLITRLDHQLYDVYIYAYYVGTRNENNKKW